MEKVRKAVFVLEYEQKDITTDIVPFVLSVTYTDHEHGKSDEIEIQLEDRVHLWKSGWYPAKGDVMNLMIGYEGEKMLPCGLFELDEIEFNGPPDTVSLRGLATYITKSLRQKNTKAFEDKTLKQVAEEIAQTHKLELLGEIKDLKIKRVTQKEERDLSFLKRIAEEYGYVFRISEGKLVFYEISELEKADSILVIDRKDMLQFNFKDKTNNTFKGVDIKYLDPEHKELISHSIEFAGETGDMLKITERCENKEQAIAKAVAALKKGNGLKTEGSFSVSGETRLIAGSNVECTGLYILDGKYHITSSKHIIDRSSKYKTEVEVKRVV